jgi:signal transduction histidine kinase
LSLERGQILVSPFDLNVEHGALERPFKPMVRFLTPVCNAEGEKQGFVVINYLGAHLLGKLKEISSGFRGQTMLLNLAGEYLQAPNSAHEWGWMLGHEHSFRQHFRQAWQEYREHGAGAHRVAGDLFSFQPVSPAATTTDSLSERPGGRQSDSDSTLLLVAYVPQAVVAARSSELLRQMLMLFAGTQLLVAVLTLYWARSVAIRRDQEHRLAESEARLRRLSSRLLTAQETERRNLSRMLHDELGQQVTAITLDLKSAVRQASQGAAEPLLRRAIQETEGLLRSVHELARAVRPSVLDDIGLREAMESYVAEYENRTGIQVDCRLHFRNTRVGPRVGENVYRIFQESLANVSTHAQTNQVALSVDVRDRMLYMSIEDAGIGFATDQIKDSTRLGILGMRERVELLNGDFQLTSAPGQGTKIHVTIPLEPSEDSSAGPHDNE